MRCVLSSWICRQSGDHDYSGGGTDRNCLANTDIQCSCVMRKREINIDWMKGRRKTRVMEIGDAIVRAHSHPSTILLSQELG